jgi:dephospho-CoA kinase
MLRVGLTGGLASGKSFVGRALRELGCFLIEADEIGHQVEEPGGEGYREIVRVFGAGILDSDGTLDRRKLAAIVFHDAALLKQLTDIVHPLVRVRRRAMEEDFARAHPDGIAVTEAAILIETGSYREFDRLIVAVCSAEQQVERAMSRGHLTREEVLDRMRRQMPLDEKVKYADYIIDTSGPKEHTLAETRAIYEKLRSVTL